MTSDCKIKNFSTISLLKREHSKILLIFTKIEKFGCINCKNKSYAEKKRIAFDFLRHKRLIFFSQDCLNLKNTS